MDSVLSQLNQLLPDRNKKDSIRHAFNALDRLAELDFATFLNGLVRILSDKDVDVNMKATAAKEINRHLYSKSTFIRDMQQEKWSSLDDRTKEEIKNSMVAVLKAVNEESLVEPMNGVFATIVFACDECIEKVIAILQHDDLSEFAYAACFQIIASRVQNDFPSDVSDVYYKLVAAFEKSMASKGSPYTTLLSMKILVNALNKSQQAKKDSQINGFLNSICDKIVGKGVLESLDENICVAGVDLLTNIVKIQSDIWNKSDIQSDIKIELKRINELKWIDLLDKGLRIQLQVIGDNVSGMKNASAAVNTFVDVLNKLNLIEL